jgi:signal transduction histidine kinase
VRRLSLSGERPRDVLADVAAALLLSAGALVDVGRLSSGAGLTQELAAVPALCCTLVVALRRRNPVGASVSCLAGAAAYELLTHDVRFTFEPYAVLLTMYLVGRTEPSESRWRHRGAAAASVPAFLVVASASPQGVGSALPATVVFALIPYGVGLLAARHAYGSEVVRSRIAGLLGDQELQEHAAAHEERMRAARELHDVAAHCLTEMVIHAGAARLVAARDPVEADRALATAAESGRQATAELRRLADHPAEPPAGSRVIQLLASLDRGPASVTAVWEGSEAALPVLTDLTAHRVLQESLTNAARHAPGAVCRVVVRVDRDTLHLSVVNDAVQRRPRPKSVGYGLVGMRERVASLGGELDTGANDTGGYAVRARLPLTPPAEAIGGAVRLRRRAPSTAVVDGVVVAGWLAALLAEVATSSHRVGPVWLNVVVVAGMAVSALFRRRAPVTFLVLVSVLSTLLVHGLASRAYATLTGLYVVTVGPYAVGSWCPRRRATIMMGVWAVAATLVGLTQHADLAGIIGPLMAAGVCAGLGALMRSQRQLRERLGQTEEAVVQQNHAIQHLAVERERRRLAELHHEVVAGQVETLIASIEAARGLLRCGDAGYTRCVSEVEHGGRTALAGMRDVVGALRAEPAGSLDAGGPETRRTPSGRAEDAVIV